MKIKSLLGLGAAFCSLLTAVNITDAQGTKIAYQGRLYDGASPANGSYDLALSLCSRIFST